MRVHTKNSILTKWTVTHSIFRAMTRGKLYPLDRSGPCNSFVGSLVPLHLGHEEKYAKWHSVATCEYTQKNATLTKWTATHSIFRAMKKGETSPSGALRSLLLFCRLLGSPPPEPWGKKCKLAYCSHMRVHTKKNPTLTKWTVTHQGSHKKFTETCAV